MTPDAWKPSIRGRLWIWWNCKVRKFPCWRCWRLAKHLRCENCSNWYCLRHCEWDDDSTWEYPTKPYPVCPRESCR